MFPRAQVSLLHHVFSIQQGPRNAVCRSQQSIQMRQGFTFKALKTRLSFLLVHDDRTVLAQANEWQARREMRKPPPRPSMSSAQARPKTSLSYSNLTTFSFEHPSRS